MQSSISPSPNWFKPSTSTWGDPRLAEFLSLCCGAALREAAGPRAQQAPALVRQSTCAGVCVCVCVCTGTRQHCWQWGALPCSAARAHDGKAAWPSTQLLVRGHVWGGKRLCHNRCAVGSQPAGKQVASTCLCCSQNALAVPLSSSWWRCFPRAVVLLAER